MRSEIGVGNRSPGALENTETSRDDFFQSAMESKWRVFKQVSLI